MSETMGRCRSEVDSYRKPEFHYAAIADAIDRLAEDVAAIKEKVDAISPEDVAHLLESEKAWVRLVEEKETAAIRERDEARTLLGLARVQRTVAYADRDEALAEVDRLRAELAARPPANSPWISDSSPAVTQPAAPPAGWLTEEERQILANLLLYQWGNLGWPARVVPALNAILARAGSPPVAPPAGWLTDEERHILGAHVQALRDQRRAMERGGQTLVYSEDFCGLKREADAIDALLARAGSPPVVVLPTVFQHSSLGDKLVALQQVKDALDKAGVAWKEVGRE